MKLYLIRHGETVDNIAGVYAGVKDSQLTNYGVEQTKKLGNYFASTDVVFTHIFASPLIRAYRTAEAIRDAQAAKGLPDVPAIVKVPDLIEQNFGSYEGKAFHVRSSPAKTGRASHAELHKNDPGFVDVETKDAMIKRAESFISTYLMPVVDDEQEPVVAIVSHGMLLSTLWRRILLKIPSQALSIAPEVTAARGSIILEHLGGWSNTGYLHLSFERTTVLQPKDDVAVNEPTSDTAVTVTVPEEPSQLSSEQQDLTASLTAAAKASIIPHSTDASTAAAVMPRTDFAGFVVLILAIDSKTHLIGVKRQRGGIGRLAHDESQQKLTSFFKKPRKD